MPWQRRDAVGTDRCARPASSVSDFVFYFILLVLFFVGVPLIPLSFWPGQSALLLSNFSFLFRGTDRSPNGTRSTTRYSGAGELVRCSLNVLLQDCGVWGGQACD